MNFENSVAEIQQKYEREREKVGERKFWISVIILPKFLLLKSKTNCGNVITEIGEKKNLWQCHYWNREIERQKIDK